jgi:hypothetical protein
MLRPGSDTGLVISGIPLCSQCVEGNRRHAGLGRTGFFDAEDALRQTKTWEKINGLSHHLSVNTQITFDGVQGRPTRAAEVKRLSAESERFY